MAAEGDAAASFEVHRTRLVRVAYRMLGSIADAEDVVQDAFLRWLDTDRSTVSAPEGFLVRVVTRLCLDLLKSSRRKRETYIGPWLPEPLVEDEVDVTDDITLPLLLALERLSPLERATFLLHDVFGVPLVEVGTVIARSPQATRQLASRARRHVHDARPRFTVDEKQGFEMAEAFFRASRSGDLAALKSLLGAEIVFVADGGGNRPAGMAPIVGIDAVIALHSRLAELFARRSSTLVRYALINGLPGFISIEPDGELQTTAMATEAGRIVGIYCMRNPDKLKHLHARVPN